MFDFKLFAAAPALVLLMGGTAQAALTADQLWQSWKDGAAEMGLTITAATEANSGGVLTLNGVTVQPAGGVSPLTISDLTLTENSDGTVTIVPGAAIGVTEGDATAGGSFSLTHSDLSVTASEGEDGAVNYDYAADTLTLAFNAAQPGYSFTEEPAKPTTFGGNVTFTALEGSYSDTPGDNRVLGVELTAETMRYDFGTEDPNMQMKTSSVSEVEAPDITVAVTLPSGIAMGAVKSAADFATALTEGFAVEATMEQGKATGTSSQEDPYMPYTMTVASLPSSSALSFDKDAVSVTTAGEGGELSITSPAIPAPIKITMKTVAMEFLSPVMAAETAGDYALKLGVEDFSLNEEAWALADPAAALKRDPLNLSIDIGGKAKLDWVAMIAAEEAGQPAPEPQPETLDIADISLSVAGAALNAVGAFTFDNSMGIPAPVGTADVSISGASQLLDGLIAVGVLTEQDAGSVRAMMAAFTTPGTEPDSVTSKIEAKEGFQLFVNGQQVQ